jgi:chemotaxis protein histidine kinase CheA
VSGQDEGSAPTDPLVLRLGQYLNGHADASNAGPSAANLALPPAQPISPGKHGEQPAQAASAAAMQAAQLGAEAQAAADAQAAAEANAARAAVVAAEARARAEASATKAAEEAAAAKAAEEAAAAKAAEEAAAAKAAEEAAAAKAAEEAAAAKAKADAKANAEAEPEPEAMTDETAKAEADTAALAPQAGKQGKPSPEEIKRLKAEKAAEKAAKRDRSHAEKEGGESTPEAKAKEKLLAKVIKEGGKKGVEIEGASDLGGLDFFCTTLELPEGDVGMLLLAMEAMNADADPEAEDRKGCSGHVGKMIFSAGIEQLAIVAYVPDKAHNKSAEKIDINTWVNAVLTEVSGEIVDEMATAKSPKGGTVVTARAMGDKAKGKFPIKDKDTAMAAAFAYLRSQGAFPEDNEDDSDDMVFGDDDNLDDYE